ncbi:helix-turn-helix domain-containing protein [Desulfurella amilsii]|uniref:helix-turn-helix domain-containing protein n=1 Tax=Desulfurella amilsii TaxID=1562698 RepID=UPI000A325063|nr:helix-turn-helix transcriptional regulator [Desulfurella amilsii]
MSADESLRLKSNLSTLMGKYRYSIKDVHEKTGLSRNTISSLYNDKATRIDFETVLKLCCLFKCDVNELLILSKCEAE